MTDTHHPAATGEALAPYACRAGESRGRLYPIGTATARSAYQRDRDRIIHCHAFRRLKHKTQVFVLSAGDHTRTRLTHTLEVAQIARSLARALRLDEDLCEAIALAHDLGHTPFGHAGEDGLAAAMADWGGFDHNAQSLRIVTLLERRYAAHDGLNLSWECLEGIAKHNGPIDAGDVPYAIAHYNTRHDLALHTWPSLEAQVAALADDIAYNTHDIDDGVRARLFDVDALTDLQPIGAFIDSIRTRYGDIDSGRLMGEVTRRLIGRIIEDVLEQTRKNLARHQIDTPDGVRAHERALVAFSAPMANTIKDLRKFLFERMYHHQTLLRELQQAKHVVSELFSWYMANPEDLPAAWQAPQHSGMAPLQTFQRARLVADYVAGMTDRYALRRYREIAGDALPAPLRQTLERNAFDI